MSRWLAIETSSSQVSLAMGEQSSCLREVSKTGNASQLIEPLFRKLDVDLQGIQRCVIGQGPGSYNGLRVGYAFLKGLLCLEVLPVVQVFTPFVLAAQAMDELKKKDGIVLVLNNARRQEIYAALISARDGIPQKEWERVGSEKTIRAQLPNRLDAVVSYDYSPADLPTLGSERWLTLFPTASMAGKIAHKLDLPSTRNLSELEPLYVREPVPK